MSETENLINNVNKGKPQKRILLKFSQKIIHIEQRQKLRDHVTLESTSSSEKHSVQSPSASP